MEKLNFWQKLVRSADNVTKNAYSARKLTALVIIICIVIGHGFYYRHCYTKEDFSIFDTILIIDYIAAGFFLGLITVEQLIILKNNTSSTSTTLSTTTTEIETEIKKDEPIA